MLENYTCHDFKAWKNHKEKIQRRALRIANAWEWIEGIFILVVFTILVGVALFVYGGMGIAAVGASGLLW